MVVNMSRHAEALLERNNGLTLRHRRLTATDASQMSRLEQLVKSAAITGAGRGVNSGGAMLLHCDGGSGQPLPITVTPFHSSHVLTEESPCALVFISDPAAKPASRGAVFSALYGLTPAECRLADLMLEELELRRAAERMRVTVNTARFMLKIIFQKTGTHRQSQLVRLLMSIPGETRLCATRARDSQDRKFQIKKAGP